jgi:predicted  nucleic acid-binding Zn-ribbon protein
MRGCPRCGELSEYLEKLVISYWAAVDDNQRLAATHADKPSAEMAERTARSAMEDARKALEDHMKCAHPHIVGN